MAAGLAALKELTPDAFAHLNGLGERLRNGLEERMGRKGVAVRVACTGSVFSIHFTDEEVVNYRSLTRTDKQLAYRVFLVLLEQGYLLNAGLAMCALSLPMDTGHVDGLIDAVASAVG